MYSLFKKLTLIISRTPLVKVKLLFQIHLFLVGLFHPKSITAHGMKFYLDSKDSTRLSIHPELEPGVAKFMRKKIKKGMIVIDAGAHIGYFTLFMARLAGDKGKVYAVEPDKNNISILKKNISANHISNVVTKMAAITSSSKPVKLYISDGVSWDHRIGYGKDEKKRKYRKVDGVALDKLTKGRVDFIKMDIQGAELLAFNGAKKIFKNNKNLVVVVEFWPYGLSKTGCSANEMIGFLKRYGAVRVLDVETGRTSKLPTENFDAHADEILYTRELVFTHK